MKKIKTINSKTNRALGEQFRGMDIRADGGYAVAFGKNTSGEYTWFREPTPYKIDELPAPLREYLGLDQQASQPPIQKGPLSSSELLTEALKESEDGRNDAGFNLACKLRDNGYSCEEAELVMRDYQESVAPVNPRGDIQPYTIDESLVSLNSAYSDTFTIVHDAEASNLPNNVDHLPAVATIPWPSSLRPEAHYGIMGEMLKVIGPHTEADLAALVFSFLVVVGNIIGRSAHFVAESDKHYCNLFVTLVGMTSKGRKGTSLGRIMGLVEQIDPAWMRDRIQSGLSSGEGLIWAVRDPVEKLEPIKENKQVTGYQTVTVDEGVTDKRLLVIEGEFASPLNVMRREGNTLSPVIRNSWDTGNLNILTKNSPANSTGAHISILGHITKDELLRCLSSNEAGNGFGNRILWACAKRSKVLPEGGNLTDQDLAPLIDKIRIAVEFAQGVGEMRRDEEAKKLWHEVYHKLSEGKPGLLGAMTARAEAQVMRIAMLYALLDCSPVIRRVHLEAALALWQYAEESAKFIFGDSLGDPVADEILGALREAPDGLTRTDISTLFGRNKKATDIGRALSSLQERGLIRSGKIKSAGAKAIEGWFAIVESHNDSTVVRK